MSGPISFYTVEITYASRLLLVGRASQRSFFPPAAEGERKSGDTPHGYPQGIPLRTAVPKNPARLLNCPVLPTPGAINLNLIPANKAADRRKCFPGLVYSRPSPAHHAT